MFPVETISAKMLDYYVGRRDTLIIDLREKESYMHSLVKGAVNMPFQKGKYWFCTATGAGQAFCLQGSLQSLGTVPGLL